MKIGQYETVRLLGKGGMSEVYEVENLRLGSRHALKLFTYEKDDPEVRERFLTEGRLLARLSHPRIVKVTDFGTDETSGRPYFVMDLVLNERGEMLQLSDVEPGTVDEETIGRWYDDLREGLAYIHANGVVHRDLKLQNVLIGPDGHAVLTDFGISKIFDVKDDGRPVVDTVKTLVKMREGRSLVMGSLGYMAPELEMGVAASPQSDWYALGVIVYRLLTGTWCDARTDVVGTLETYDPVWKRIIPKLLHSNPNGRECLSYADEKRLDREKSEADWEIRWLKEKERGHNARHLARYAAIVLVAFCGALYWMHARYSAKLEVGQEDNRRLRAELSVPSFADICKVPQKSNEGHKDAFPLDFDRDKLALIDVWVLTHTLFDDLKSRQISHEKAVEELEALANRADESTFGLFKNTGGYNANGDVRTLRKILRDAVQEMKRRSTSKGKSES